MNNKSKHIAGHTRTVTVGRRRFPVIDEVRIAGRKYLLLQRLTGGRKKFLAWSPSAGPNGRLCTMMELPISDSTAQHIHVLSRLPTQCDLPRIIDYQKRNRRTDLVMGWVEGVDLTDYLDRIRRNKVDRPTPMAAVRLVRGLAHALRTLNHHAQLIHGDLKPANLILTRKPSRLLMIDFGSAWPIERSGYRANGDGLTRVYASPEQQVADGVVDHRSDQFTTSIVLYQLLTMKIPYQGYGGKAGRPEFRSDLERTLVPPSRGGMIARGTKRRLRKDLDQLVLTGLQLNQDKRFLTNSMWLDAIESIYLKFRLAEKGIA